MRVLGIVPARGGSKGVPGKNVRPVAGRPLIEYTLDCAVASDVCAELVISSDDDRVERIAGKYPDARFLRRPAELASDTASIVAVVEQVMDELAASGLPEFDAIMLLQPTSPMREPRHLTEAVSALADGAASVISVCEMQEVHPARMYKAVDRKPLQSLMPEYEQARRQDIPPVYYRNGSIYLVTRAAFLEQKMLMAKPAHPYVMGEEYLLNIDEPRDIMVAEALLTQWQHSRG